MKQWHILAYDVRDEKRLRKLHYYLRKRAIPLQKSVFLLHCTASELADTLQGVRERIRMREDDIRLYPVTTPHSIWSAGQQSNAMRGLYPGKPASEPAQAPAGKGLIERIVYNLRGSAHATHHRPQGNHATPHHWRITHRTPG